MALGEMATVKAWGTHTPTGISKVCLELYRSGFKNKKIRKRLRKYILSHSHVFDVCENGIKMRCHVSDNTTERDIVLGGEFSGSEEIDLISSYLEPGGVFLDIGANCGIFSLAAARKLGPSGRVIAVEPNPAMVERLKFNISVNGFHNIEVVECAVGDNSGVAELQICAQQMGKSSFVATVDGPRISVQIKQLSEILREHDIIRVDGMKIDIEGFEDRAVMSLLRDTPKSLWPRCILIETCHAHYWRDGCVYHLREAGYRTEWQGPNDILLALP